MRLFMIPSQYRCVLRQLKYHCSPITSTFTLKAVRLSFFSSYNFYHKYGDPLISCLSPHTNWQPSLSDWNQVFLLFVKFYHHITCSTNTCFEGVFGTPFISSFTRLLYLHGSLLIPHKLKFWIYSSFLQKYCLNFQLLCILFLFDFICTYCIRGPENFFSTDYKLEK